MHYFTLLGSFSCLYSRIVRSLFLVFISRCSSVSVYGNECDILSSIECFGTLTLPVSYIQLSWDGSNNDAMLLITFPIAGEGVWLLEFLI